MDLVYPNNELEMKDTTECSTFPSYLDILLKLDADSKLTTQLTGACHEIYGSFKNFTPLYSIYRRNFCH
jgi:hypothetical protein